MKCRNIIKREDGKKIIIWFGSAGKDPITGKSIKDTTGTPYKNYVTEQEGLAASLTQRLSILKGELWYKVNYGLPLLEKVDKTIMDSVIIDIVLSHPDVKSIMNFKSVIVNNVYQINDLSIISAFNENITII